ncbi:PleD family two-component system response regulator [Pedobacter cryoconitis]|uniref:DNA-binding response OmpR family regulator n=1 Tax=Pedobacter cryoconitis TaxID=188932 RepID=A0A7X0J996_9SPHI|nr:response regulator [Pedobacter cryoconitis]MBB6502091.1 DNA-binding response OmpR family regulator [Pedobacter cryoconitis]
MMFEKILAVDDDSDILDVIRIILEQEGYEVLTLANGNDVLEMVRQNSPDLILLDVMLGGMDGREICKTLKEHELFKKIPVVMISASHNLHNLLLKPGAPNDFLAKPFDISNLIKIVRAQLAA